MRYLLIGAAFVAAVFGMYLLVEYIPTETLGPVGPLIAVTALFVIVLVRLYVVRYRRLHNWARTTARVESCQPGMVDEGWQRYTCTYIFWVDDARQAGSFQLWANRGRLEEIRTALVGETVVIRYNPQKCTESIVAESRIKGWDVY
jgi:hypothetical protein